MTDTTARDAKLIQYLNEAYAMEMHLETALQAHISMTSDIKYRQRLKQHLIETRRHSREVGRRVKRLGGTPETVPAPGPELLSEAAGALLGGAEKAVALAQGPLHALRGTGPEERMLKNAKTEYASEAQEIATYRGIETLAGAVGDKETVQLARTIRGDEERMRSFLEREIPRLTKAVVAAEIPAAERSSGARKRGPSGKASRSSKPAATARARSRSGARAASGAKSRASVARSRSAGRAEGATK
jgi:ferritin-like metal-binding protein YciE